MTQDLSKLYK